MGVNIDPVEAYQRGAAMLGEVIVSLADQEWDIECGPENLSIDKVVAWVVVGDSQLTAAVDRGSLDQIGEIEASVLGPNLVATWRGTALAAISSLGAEGALDEMAAHPDGGLVIGDLVGQRVTENLVRSWDIALAVGRKVEIPDDLAEWCLKFWNSHTDAVMRGGVLPQEPIEPSADADAATRLLAFTGRKPS